MNKKEQILTATKELLWNKGYENTSPRDIQDLSGAGQGSFYHHFRSKRDLVAEAISQVVEERIAAFDRAISKSGTVKERIYSFLQQRKKPLLGCRVGRMVWDSAIDDDKLRLPLARYFNHVEKSLTDELQNAVSVGQVELTMPADQVALMIITIVQGSFTISRALQVSRADDVAESLHAFLELTVIEK